MKGQVMRLSYVQDHPGPHNENSPRLRSLNRTISKFRSRTAQWRYSEGSYEYIRQVPFELPPTLRKVGDKFSDEILGDLPLGDHRHSYRFLSLLYLLLSEPWLHLCLRNNRRHVHHNVQPADDDLLHALLSGGRYAMFPKSSTSCYTRLYDRIVSCCAPLNCRRNPLSDPPS